MSRKSIWFDPCSCKPKVGGYNSFFTTLHDISGLSRVGAGRLTRTSWRRIAICCFTGLTTHAGSHEQKHAEAAVKPCPLLSTAKPFHVSTRCLRIGHLETDSFRIFEMLFVSEMRGSYEQWAKELRCYQSNLVLHLTGYEAWRPERREWY